MRDYLAEIEQLLDVEQFSEADVHCRHILRHFPRHIDTYRLLGRVLLEQNKFVEATEMFQRVLSAEPNDFISQLGLSIACKESSLVAQAVWHLSRALEMEPYNQTVKKDLRRLISMRDGDAPAQIGMSRATLAHLHFKGQLYKMAQGELRQLIAEDEERIDLKVLLLKSYWYDGQRLDALSQAEEVLFHLPNCLMALAVLAESWIYAGRSAEAQPLLQNLQSMLLLDVESCDLETAVGTALAANEAFPLPDKIMVEYLSIHESPKEWGAEDGQEDWFLSSAEALKNKLEEENSEPDWFEDLFSEPELEETDALPSGSQAGTTVNISNELENNVMDERKDEEKRPEETVDLTESSQEALPEQNVASQSEEEMSDVDPDDLEAAMAWLEQLAAQQGAPLDELPTVDELPPVDPLPLVNEGILKDQMNEKSDAVDSDDLPDWLQQLPEAPQGDEEEALLDAVSLPLDDAIPADDLPDWLDFDQKKTNTSMEDAATDSMTWLEELNAGQTVTEEMPTMSWPREDEEEDQGDIFTESPPTPPKEPTISDIPELPETDEEPEQEDAMAWLEALATGEGEPIEELPTMVVERDLEPEADVSAEQIEADVLPAAEIEDLGEVSESDGDDSLDWLEQLAVSQDSPLEELPSIADRALASEILAESEVHQEEDIDDLFGELIPEDVVEETSPSVPLSSNLMAALTYLERLAVEDGVALDEVVVDDMALSDDDLELALTRVDGLTLVSDGWPEMATEMPEDPEEALAWLDQLVDEADVSNAELVAESGEHLVRDSLEDVEEEEDGETAVSDDSSPVDDAEYLSEIPDDPDDAIAWLEQLAVQEDVSAEESPVDPEIGSDETADFEEEIAEENTEAITVAEGAFDESDIPEDPDDAMVWLEQLAARQGAPLDELPSVEEAPELEEEIVADETALEGIVGAVVEAVAEESVETVDVIEEPIDESDIPDDPDDAMAWLEQLAARQGAPLDELPSVEEALELEEVIVTDEAAPDEIVESVEAAAEENAETVGAVEEPEMEDAFVEEDRQDSEIIEATEEVLLEEEEAVETFLEAEDDFSDSSDQPLGWLDELDEPDVTGWLAAEEEATAEDVVVDETEIDSGQEIPTRPTMLVPDEAVVEVLPIVDSPERSEALPVLDSDDLSRAREALSSGENETAVAAYDSLIRDGDNLSMLIADLETAVQNNPKEPPFHRLLGDAYMQNGQLQKALEVYRNALDYL